MTAWSLARSVAAFAGALRTEGVTVGPAETLDALRALEASGPLDRRRFAATLRACMAKTPADRERFDTVFAAFWQARFVDPAQAVDSDEQTDETTEAASGVGADGVEPAIADAVAAPAEPQDSASEGASAQARRMQIDFARVDATERAAMETLIRVLGQQLARRAARRWRHRRRGTLDLRRSMRRAVARGGELFEFKRRYRARERPRLVVLADVSYSMDVYSRFFLCFVHAFAQVFRSVESFVFSTRLSHISAALARGQLEHALARLSETVEDWAGGTRIASAVEDYLHRFADHQLDRNTVVMIVSDGWDSDEPERLRAALGRLRGRCRAVIWLDPLMNHPRYFSSALGVQHASPHVDVCAPARNLDGLRALADRLSRERLV